MNFLAVPRRNKKQMPEMHSHPSIHSRGCCYNNIPIHLRDLLRVNKQKKYIKVILFFTVVQLWLLFFKISLMFFNMINSLSGGINSGRAKVKGFEVVIVI